MRSWVSDDSDDCFVPVYDCEVSEWGSWSECSAGPGPGSCGRGTSERRRSVTRPESNGGVSCPDLHQTRVCHVTCPEPATREKSATDEYKPRRLSGRKHKESSALRGVEGQDQQT